MRCLLALTVWWMNFATLLASWMLRFGGLVSKEGSLQLTVRLLSKNGSIVRTSPAVTLSQCPPLVHPLTNTGKHSTTWFLLQSTNRPLGSLGFAGEANGGASQMGFTLSTPGPPRGP